MRRSGYLAAIIVPMLLLSALKVDAQTPVGSKDASDIRASIDAMQAAWNRHDMNAWVGYMADDVEWVNIVGMVWRGRAQVLLAHDRMHKTTFKNRQWHDAETTDLRQVAPGVVVVTEAVPMDGFTAPDGTATAPSRNMLTLVYVHRAGRWLVVEGHNTIVDPQAALHDPGK
jgi:uncharacterized protein (TIGR02246 family)